MPLIASRALRVLIVDDHAAFRRAARELLEHRGYAVVGEADGAAAALDAARRHAPEAILLDVHLGDGSGFEVCREIKRDHPEAEVLLVSATEPRRSVQEFGACGFVLKARLAEADFDALWVAAVRRRIRTSDGRAGR